MPQIATTVIPGAPAGANVATPSLPSVADDSASNRFLGQLRTALKQLGSKPAARSGAQAQPAADHNGLAAPTPDVEKDGTPSGAAAHEHSPAAETSLPELLAALGFALVPASPAIPSPVAVASSSARGAAPHATGVPPQSTTPLFQAASTSPAAGAIDLRGVLPGAGSPAAAAAASPASDELARLIAGAQTPATGSQTPATGGQASAQGASGGSDSAQRAPVTVRGRSASAQGAFGSAPGATASVQGTPGSTLEARLAVLGASASALAGPAGSAVDQALSAATQAAGAGAQALIRAAQSLLTGAQPPADDARVPIGGTPVIAATASIAAALPTLSAGRTRLVPTPAPVVAPGSLDTPQSDVTISTTATPLSASIFLNATATPVPVPGSPAAAHLVADNVQQSAAPAASDPSSPTVIATAAVPQSAPGVQSTTAPIAASASSIPVVASGQSTHQSGFQQTAGDERRSATKSAPAASGTSETSGGVPDSAFSAAVGAALPVSSAPPLPVSPQAAAVVSQIANQADLYRLPGHKGLRIQLHPDDLGGVQVTLLYTPIGGIELHIDVERAATGTLVQAGWTQLRDALVSQGISADRLVMSVTSAGGSGASDLSGRGSLSDPGLTGFAQTQTNQGGSQGQAGQPQQQPSGPRGWGRVSDNPASSADDSQPRAVAAAATSRIDYRA